MRGKTAIIIISAAAMIGTQANINFEEVNVVREIKIIAENVYIPRVVVSQETDVTFYGEIPLLKRTLYPTKRQIQVVYMKLSKPFIAEAYLYSWYDFF